MRPSVERRTRWAGRRTSNSSTSMSPLTSTFQATRCSRNAIAHPVHLGVIVNELAMIIRRDKLHHSRPFVSAINQSSRAESSMKKQCDQLQALGVLDYRTLETRLRLMVCKAERGDRTLVVHESECESATNPKFGGFFEQRAFG